MAWTNYAGVAVIGVAVVILAMHYLPKILPTLKKPDATLDGMEAVSAFIAAGKLMKTPEHKKQCRDAALAMFTELLDAQLEIKSE